MSKTNRKPWMRELKNFRFNRDGTMLSETARSQVVANSRMSTCVRLSSCGQINGFDPNYGVYFKDIEFVFLENTKSLFS